MSETLPPSFRGREASYKHWGVSMNGNLYVCANRGTLNQLIEACKRDGVMYKVFALPVLLT